jgi:hypothetical protein
MHLIAAAALLRLQPPLLRSARVVPALCFCFIS